MTSDRNPGALVLSTVNAPYRRQIDADTPARWLLAGETDSWTVHVATFFVDVRPGLVVHFARTHGIGLETLARTYRSLRDRTGERSPALEAAFVELAKTSGINLRGPAPAAGMRSSRCGS